MRTQLRWPLHPRPAEREALSSWVSRLAALYGLSVRDLVCHNLCPAPTLPAEWTAESLDWDAPAAVLGALAERTGVLVSELRSMTISGWVPWLLDSLDEVGQDGFDTYVHQHSVLLTGKPRRYAVATAWRAWIPDRPVRRVCPVCAANPDHGTPLTAGLPLMLSCVKHGCQLRPDLDVTLAALTDSDAPPEPVSEPIAAMDRRTHEGLHSGTVALPGRAAHVGVWFRLLRTLLHELTLPLACVSSRSRTALELIWRSTGAPVRAGLSVWRPYEQLGWERQEQLLEAAATTLHVVEDGAITARGTLAPLLTREPHRPVFEGDPPSQRDRELRRAKQEIDAAIDAARTDTDGALNVLRMFTGGCRTLQCFNRDRQFLIRLGIPAHFLPDAHEFGRDELVHSHAHQL